MSTVTLGSDNLERTVTENNIAFVDTVFGRVDTEVEAAIAAVRSLDPDEGDQTGDTESAATRRA